MNTHVTSVRISLLFFLLVQVSTILAQKDSISDVFSNKKFFYTNVYKEITERELNPSDKIGTSYFAVHQKEYFSNNLNRQIEQMAVADWMTEEGKFHLFSEVKKLMLNYQQLADQRNNSYPIATLNSSELEKVELKPLSIVQDKLTFVEHFRLKLLLQGERYREENMHITFSYYYIADLQTGKIILQQAKLDSNMQLTIKQVLLPYMADIYDKLSYSNANKEVGYGAETEEVPITATSGATTQIVKDNTLAKAQSILRNIDLEQINYYWIGWGLVVSFPRYSLSNGMPDGEGSLIFLPFNECKDLLKFFPQYSFIENLSLPQNNFKNFDYFDLINQLNSFRYEPATAEIFRYNKVALKPKTLSVGSYQVFKNDKKNFRGTYIYEFGYNEDITKHSSQRKNYSFYTNENGKLIKNENKSSIDLEDNKYDLQGNLVYKDIGKKEGSAGTYFFYNRDNLYFINYSATDLELTEKVTALSLINNRLCFSDACFTLDDNMKLQGKKPLRSYSNDVQVAYDNKGRLIEAHSDNDRYNFYYEYDSQDRLIRYTTYEVTRLQKEVQFFYKENSSLPYFQKKHTENNGNDIFEEETYEWIYY